jgi:excinuclease ABC subunit C
VSVVFIRNGSVLGSRNHFPKVAGDPSQGELMSGFLAQYYLGREAPGEVIVDSPVDDEDLLQAEMSARSGHPVKIRHRVRGDRQRWVEMARTNAEQGLSMEMASNATLRRQFEALGQALALESSPERLECFDISHTSGEATVASCVVFNRTGPLKSDYRRFNLSAGAAGDDYAAMREALQRRYARVKKGEVVMPDILFVDGGKGQLNEAMTVLDELEIEALQVVAVAKGRSRKPGQEQLFMAGRRTATILPPDSPALLLIQQIRDEAHRFAITGHRQRRGKARRTSTLEQIPGLGPKRRRELLRQFGGLQGVREAGVNDLAKVHGISRNLAERIYSDLHSN